MKFRLYLILFFFFLSFSYAQEDEKPDTALSLEQLLELVQQGKFAESEEAAKREQKFARERSRQATLLANAKAERSRLEAIATELEGKFEANDAKLVVLEEQLKTKKDYKKHLAENVLPNLFAEVGLSELKLADGRHLKVSNYYGASIKDTKKEAAFSWLRDNGFGDLIKNQVSCSFGRNEDEKAKSLINTLDSQGYQSMQREWVEPSTLRAFIREQHEAGKELPMDLLGAFVGQKTTIKD